MFSVGDNVFSHKNAISKNIAEKTSYLPKVEYIKSISTDLVKMQCIKANITGKREIKTGDQNDRSCSTTGKLIEKTY
jgi:hypothetical protein